MLQQQSSGPQQQQNGNMDISGDGCGGGGPLAGNGGMMCPVTSMGMVSHSMAQGMGPRLVSTSNANLTSLLNAKPAPSMVGQMSVVRSKLPHMAQGNKGHVGDSMISINSSSLAASNSLANMANAAVLTSSSGPGVISRPMGPNASVQSVHGMQGVNPMHMGMNGPLASASSPMGHMTRTVNSGSVGMSPQQRPGMRLGNPMPQNMVQGHQYSFNPGMNPGMMNVGANSGVNMNSGMRPGMAFPQQMPRFSSPVQVSSSGPIPVSLQAGQQMQGPPVQQNVSMSGPVPVSVSCPTPGANVNSGCGGGIIMDNSQKPPIVSLAGSVQQLGGQGPQQGQFQQPLPSPQQMQGPNQPGQSECTSFMFKFSLSRK